MFLSSLGGVRNIKGFVKTSKPSKGALGWGGFKAHKRVFFKPLRVQRLQRRPNCLCLCQVWHRCAETFARLDQGLPRKERWSQAEVLNNLWILEKVTFVKQVFEESWRLWRVCLPTQGLPLRYQKIITRSFSASSGSGGDTFTAQ